MRPNITPEFMARVRWHESMSTHTSWRAGGQADMFFVPRDIEDLSSFLRALSPDVPVYWVGLGSNLLVRDGGIRGVVVATAGAFTRIERRSQSRVYCQASVPCARIARACVNWGLGQAEFFGGIPGTFGGALAMNAGAFGDETWRHVLSVETIDRRGQRRERTPQDFRIGYRQVEPAETASGRAGGQEWFLSAELQFEPRTGEPRNSVRSLTERRRQTQPIGRWSCGSVFKNPPGDHAARLIDAAGLKGYRIGDAVVSEKHANFIINDGHASATELEQLIRHVQHTVQHMHGVALEPEVRIVGEPVTAGALAGDAD
ncbi:MAG TPA: UDP-N-acetylmuramate dehydrogenase [Steroidobacteraceae bacterium]|jgi:UDP-N-acetylmuramate dehydrogenase